MNGNKRGQKFGDMDTAHVFLGLLTGTQDTCDRDGKLVRIGAPRDGRPGMAVRYLREMGGAGILPVPFGVHTITEAEMIATKKIMAEKEFPDIAEGAN